MISAAELASIQAAAVSAACDQTCQIYRKTTETADGYGSSTPTWTLITTTVAGMVEPSGTQLQNYDYLIGSLATWHVRLPVGTNVEHQDHLVIGGATLEVQVVLQPRSIPALLSVLASEVV